MPQLDPAGFVPQLFWLAVIFLVLFLLMRGLAVPRVGRAIEARRQRLDGDLGRAAAMRAEAVLAGYETALAAARGEAQTRLRETAEQMAAAAAERQRELAATLARQVAAAESRIAADVGRAMVEKLTGATPDAAKLAAAVDAALAGDAPAGRAS